LQFPDLRGQNLGKILDHHAHAALPHEVDLVGSVEVRRPLGGNRRLPGGLDFDQPQDQIVGLAHPAGTSDQDVLGAEKLAEFDGPVGIDQPREGQLLFLDDFVDFRTIHQSDRSSAARPGKMGGRQ
jgi:hypothetical protein